MYTIIVYSLLFLSSLVSLIYEYLVFTLVLCPVRKPEIQIICLFILYKPQTVLSILAFI